MATDRQPSVQRIEDDGCVGWFTRPFLIGAGSRGLLGPDEEQVNDFSNCRPSRVP